MTGCIATRPRRWFLVGCALIVFGASLCSARAGAPFIDCNNNGIADEIDISEGTSSDCNVNAVPDECDIADETSLDCEPNGIPDECELIFDCNLNGVSDACDITAGEESDCNGDRVPDSCDFDCNMNGVSDICDIVAGNSADCNGNGVPDPGVNNPDSPDLVCLDFDRDHTFDPASAQATRALNVFFDHVTVTETDSFGIPLPNPQAAAVFARATSFVGTRVFARHLSQSGERWAVSDQVQLRVDFDFPQSIVQFEVVGATVDSGAQLLLFDENGAQIGTPATTTGLRPRQRTQLRASAPTPGIRQARIFPVGNPDSSILIVVLRTFANNDCNVNGLSDNCGDDALFGDCQRNGVPDMCDVDCNANNLADACELPHAVSQQIFRSTNYGYSQESFGASVSMDNDFAVVGAPNRSVYVVQTSSEYSPLYPYLLLPGDYVELYFFGWSVALDADTAVCSDYGLHDFSGSVFVYTYQTPHWKQQAELRADAPQLGAYFGYSVDLQGDVLLAGAPGDLVGGQPTGAAYVFTREASIWSQQARLVAGDAAANSNFGSAVALDGDSALIGAWDAGGEGEGAAYVFVSDGTNWAQQAKLTRPNSGSARNFGTAVALDGATAVVGARGGAFVFVRNGDQWTIQGELRTTDPAAPSSFGARLSVSGNLAIVGTGELTQNCWLYLFARNGGTWQYKARLNGIGNVGVLRGNQLFSGAPHDALAYLSEIVDGPLHDCDANGAPDDCDLSSGAEFDCNENGLLDVCDLVLQSSLDINGNGVPDECEDFIPGDLDFDGDVDLDDFLLFAKCYSGANQPSPCAPPNRADLDGDGDVDLSDFVIFATNFTG